MEEQVPKELLYAIMIAAALDDTSEFYGDFPDYTGELDD